MQHHRITGSFGFKDFDGTAEESAYWNKATEEQKQALKKKHVDTGLCLLCMIDELIPKSSEPQRVVIEPGQKSRKREEITPATRSKKIVGGIINRSNERAETSSPNMKVSWAWYNEDAGIVAWTLQNISAQQTTAILLRNSYYFGNAYWPIYKNNPGFGVTFASNLEPLTEKSLQSNSAPLGIVSWKKPDGSYKSIVAFVFTLFPGQTWQMLEAGFSHLRPPQNVGIFEVSRTSEAADSFSLSYDQEQVYAWDAQTGNSDKGFSPNPNVINTVQVLAPPEAPFEQLFEGDSIHLGNDPAPTLKEEGLPKEVEEKVEEEKEQRPPLQQEEQAAIELEAPSTSTTGGGSKSLWSLLGKQTSSGKN
jgi:hypothetical protein